ncbi:MAG: putative metallopeptidase [Candidatus Heimdallarchaeaceae archaeon]
MFSRNNEIIPAKEIRKKIEYNMIKYERAEDLEKQIALIVSTLKMKHINLSRVFCIRSKGSKSKNILARCHALPRIIQETLNLPPAYFIEVIQENFDRLSKEEKIKTLIHELLHIPKSFKGGFRHHDHVTKKRVESLYKKFVKNLNLNGDSIL